MKRKIAVIAVLTALFCACTALVGCGENNWQKDFGFERVMLQEQVSGPARKAHISGQIVNKSDKTVHNVTLYIDIMSGDEVKTTVQETFASIEPGEKKIFTLTSESVIASSLKYSINRVEYEK